jgi:hypothetical protein
MTLEEVVLDCNVLSRRSHPNRSGGRDCDIVVLKNGGLDDRVRNSQEFHSCDNFQQESSQRNQLSHGLTQGNVLSFSCRECNLGLKLGIPLNGTPSEGHHISRSRLHAHWVLVAFVILEACDIKNKNKNLLI